VRYNNFHTTALCSPSRSCFLTGRNHHSNAMAAITEVSTGYPGYNGRVPLSHGLLSEMLTPFGWAAFAIGKWHLTPVEDMSLAANRKWWPLGRGFDRYYGFLGGDTDQYYPWLTYDNHFIKPPKTPEEGYHNVPDLTDKAKEFIGDLKQAAPDRPFFMYFCPGACHAPHHAPPEWIEKYKGAFDAGWDDYQLRLFQEATLQVGVVLVLELQHLDGEGALQSRVVDAVDDAHPPSADFPLHPIPAQLRRHLLAPRGGHRTRRVGERGLVGATVVGSRHVWGGASGVGTGLGSLSGTAGFGRGVHRFLDQQRGPVRLGVHCAPG
jgi:hypothetical protein